MIVTIHEMEHATNSILSPRICYRRAGKGRSLICRSREGCPDNTFTWKTTVSCISSFGPSSYYLNQKVITQRRGNLIFP